MAQDKGADNTPKKPPHPPKQELVEGVLRFVPLLETYFRRAHSEMPDQLRRLFVHHHLTARHGTVLTQLAHGQELTVGELSERLEVRMSTISELVGDLSRVGLLQRRNDPDNRRRILVTLPAKHQDLMREFMARRAQPLLHALETLDSDELAGFAKGLQAWARALEQH